MVKFNTYEKAILDLLYRFRIPLSTKQVSERTGIAWETAKKYLEKLNKGGHIHKKKRGNKIMWWRE